MRTISATLFILVFSTFVSALDIIPKGGLTISKYYNESEEISGTAKTADGLNFYVGLDKNINKNFTVGLDVMLLGMSGINYIDEPYDDEFYIYTKHYISSFNSGLAPIVKGFLNISEISRIYVHGGAMIAVSYNNKYTITETKTHKYRKGLDEKDEWKQQLTGDIQNLHGSLVGGVGLSYAGVIFESRIIYGLTDLELFEGIESYNRIFSASIGYTFSNTKF